MIQRETLGLESLLPEHILEHLEPPNRALNEKVTARFTDREFELLEALARERHETTTAVVRKLILAALAEVNNQESEADS